MHSDEKEQTYLQVSHNFTRELATAVNNALEGGLAPALVIGGLHLSMSDLTRQVLTLQDEERRRGAH